MDINIGRIRGRGSVSKSTELRPDTAENGGRSFPMNGHPLAHDSSSCLRRGNADICSNSIHTNTQGIIYCTEPG
jgi:hypothetical protein